MADEQFTEPVPVPKTVSEEKRADRKKPGPKPKRELPWLKQYQFKAGQPCPFKSPGRPPKKVINELILAELERVATKGDAKGKSKMQLLTERYVDAAAGLIKVSPTELDAMEKLLLRFAGKGEAGKEEEKNKNSTVAVLVGRLNQNDLPALPPAEPDFIEGETVINEEETECPTTEPLT